MPKIKYTKEIKIQIVEEVLKNKRSKKWLSKETGIEVTTIRKWVAAYEENSLAISYHHKQYQKDSRFIFRE